MDNFLIITNSDKDKDLIVTKKIEKILSDKKKNYKSSIVRYMQEENKYHYINSDKISKDIECALVLGGDGTLLRVARDLIKLDIPLLGINLGTLGYLAEIEADNVEAAILSLINDKYNLEERMMIKGRVKNKKITDNFALNDIVISKDGAISLIDFKLYVNNKFLAKYSADGIIISTPTGSTGYSLSAGGPIIEPLSDIILITPICPHTLNTRSLVFSSNDEIKIKLCESKREMKSYALLIIDGSKRATVYENEEVIINKAKKKTKLIKINKISFLEILKRKMNM